MGSGFTQDGATGVSYSFTLIYSLGGGVHDVPGSTQTLLLSGQRAYPFPTVVSSLKGFFGSTFRVRGIILVGTGSPYLNLGGGLFPSPNF
jgi:hypothetical protein